jgi:predicted nuclease of predicted toxin-antitoxin system
LSIRFQADADLNEDIVSGVRRREPLIDFQTADEARLRGIDDPLVLAYAAREGRILVSHDRNTMPGHFATFILTETSPGLFIISQKTDVRVAIEELIMIWVASEAEEWINTVLTVPF